LHRIFVNVAGRSFPKLARFYDGENLTAIAVAFVLAGDAMMKRMPAGTLFLPLLAGMLSCYGRARTGSPFPGPRWVANG